MSIKSKNKKVRLCLMVVTAPLVLAVLWAVLATPETALAKKPDNPGGGGGTFETVLYWVSFSQDPLSAFWSHQITGRIDRLDNPRILVNGVYGGEHAHIDPTKLRGSNGYDYVPGADGGDDFDTAFEVPDNPDGTYDGTLIISGDGTTVSMSFDALSRTGKGLHYKLTAAVDPLPGGWDPLGMSSGAIETISLGAWELKAPRGGTPKGVHAWGKFHGQTQITIERR